MSKAVNKVLGSAAILGVLSAASLPLALGFNGINFYTPYLPALLVSIFFGGVWGLQVGRVDMSRAARIYSVLPILMLLLCFIGDDRSEQFNATLPYLFGGITFVTALLVFRFFAVSSSIIVKFAFIFFVIQTCIAAVQSLGHPAFGIISMYLGPGEEVISSRGDVVRISGTFGNPNVFAQIYSLMAVIVVNHFFFSRRASQRFLGVLVIMLTGYIIVLTSSRSGILFFSLLTSGIIIGIFKEQLGSWKKTVGVLAIPAFLTLGMLLVALQFKVFFIPAESSLFQTGGRLETYLGAMALLSDPRILIHGVGGGQFFEAAAERGIYFQYKNWVPPELINSSVHNLPLQLITEFGAIAAGAYALAVIGFIRMGFNMDWPDGARDKSNFVMPLLLIFLVPFQFGTTASSPWLISFFSVYFALIEDHWWRVKRHG